MEVHGNIIRPTVTIEDEIEVIDLDSYLKSSEEVVNKWDKKIQNRICEELLGGNEQVLERFLQDYKRCLKEETPVFSDQLLVKSKILSHIRSVHFCCSGILSNKAGRYSACTEGFEDILAEYCALELSAVQHLKRRHGGGGAYDKWETGFVGRCEAVCRHLCALLAVCLRNVERNVMHVLIKLRYNTRSAACREIMHGIYSHFLAALPQQDFSDEAFCRYYLVLRRWKQIQKSEAHPIMEKIMYCRLRRSEDCMKNDESIQNILGIRQLDPAAIFSLVTDGGDAAREAYFRHMRSQGVNEYESDSLIINSDDECRGTETVVINDDEDELVLSDDEVQIVQVTRGVPINISDDEEERNPSKNSSIPPDKTNETVPSQHNEDPTIMIPTSSTLLEAENMNLDETQGNSARVSPVDSDFKEISIEENDINEDENDVTRRVPDEQTIAQSRKPAEQDNLNEQSIENMTQTRTKQSTGKEYSENNMKKQSDMENYTQNHRTESILSSTTNEDDILRGLSPMSFLNLELSSVNTSIDLNTQLCEPSDSTADAEAIKESVVAVEAETQTTPDLVSPVFSNEQAGLASEVAVLQPEGETMTVVESGEETMMVYDEETLVDTESQEETFTVYETNPNLDSEGCQNEMEVDGTGANTAELDPQENNNSLRINRLITVDGETKDCSDTEKQMEDTTIVPFDVEINDPNLYAIINEEIVETSPKIDVPEKKNTNLKGCSFVYDDTLRVYRIVKFVEKNGIPHIMDDVLSNTRDAPKAILKAINQEVQQVPEKPVEEKQDSISNSVPQKENEIQEKLVENDTEPRYWLANAIQGKENEVHRQTFEQVSETTQISLPISSQQEENEVQQIVPEQLPEVKQNSLLSSMQHTITDNLSDMQHSFTQLVESEKCRNGTKLKSTIKNNGQATDTVKVTSLSQHLSFEKQMAVGKVGDVLSRPLNGGYDCDGDLVGFDDSRPVHESSDNKNLLDPKPPPVGILHRQREEWPAGIPPREEEGENRPKQKRTQWSEDLKNVYVYPSQGAISEQRNTRIYWPSFAAYGISKDDVKLRGKRKWLEVVMPAMKLSEMKNHIQKRKQQRYERARSRIEENFGKPEVQPKMPPESMIRQRVDYIEQPLPVVNNTSSPNRRPEETLQSKQRGNHSGDVKQKPGPGRRRKKVNGESVNGPVNMDSLFDSLKNGTDSFHSLRKSKGDKT